MDGQLDVEALLRMRLSIEAQRVRHRSVEVVASAGGVSAYGRGGVTVDRQANVLRGGLHLEDDLGVAGVLVEGFGIVSAAPLFQATALLTLWLLWAGLRLALSGRAESVELRDREGSTR
jgi:hypothetical protein